MKDNTASWGSSAELPGTDTHWELLRENKRLKRERWARGRDFDRCEKCSVQVYFKIKGDTATRTQKGVKPRV